MSDAANRLRLGMQQIAKGAVPDTELADLVYGRVKTIMPLEIHLENGLPVYESQLVVSPFCSPRTVHQIDLQEGDHTHTYIDDLGVTRDTGKSKSNFASLTLWWGINEGDRVVMLRFSKGKVYYVLHKV